MTDPVIAGMNATIAGTSDEQPTVTSAPAPAPVPSAQPVPAGPPRILAIEFAEKAAFVHTTVGSTELTSEERAKVSAIGMKAFDRMLDEVREAVQKNSGARKRTRKSNGAARPGRPKLPRDAQGNIIRPSAESPTEPVPAGV